MACPEKKLNVIKQFNDDPEKVWTDFRASVKHTSRSISTACTRTALQSTHLSIRLGRPSTCDSRCATRLPNASLPPKFRYEP